MTDIRFERPMRMFSLGLETDACDCFTCTESKIIEPPTQPQPGTPVLKCSAGASDDCLTQNCQCFKPGAE